jgi:YesN/AraC family two-component response regulator
VLNIKGIFVDFYYLELTLEPTANHFHIHPMSLTRILKKYIGLGFMEIVQELRLEKAVLLLNNTKLNIYEIAEKWGFSNMNNFYEQFKKAYNGDQIT